MLHDTRLALRGLKSNPSFAIVAIATLALGIGATTAVFTIVNGILLRPLPYRNPDRLVLLRADVRGADRLAALAAPMKAAIEAVGPGRPVRSIRTMNEYVSDTTADARFALSALAAFAVVALALAAIGLYGVIAYTTVGRTREIGSGSRLALEPRASCGSSSATA